MKFVFAPDSFKGSLTALEAAKLLDAAARKHFPQAETKLVPVADGGEGTVEALVSATGGETRSVWVTGPMGDPVCASYGVLGDGETAVLEMAQASGLPLVFPHKPNPMLASSQGTGELIKHVLAEGFGKLLIGIGGSATNDGGMGMLTALGASFYNAEHKPVAAGGAGLASVAEADVSGLDKRLAMAQITVICDVNNPLLGEQGATYVYGPQKGATAEQMRELEAGMAQYAQVLSTAVGRDISLFAGAGAAGGMGAALGGVLGARLRSGIDAVLDAVGFDELLGGASLVITGEGRIDGQSIRYGKVPAGVAKRCAAKNVPVIALVGGMAEGACELYELMPQSSIMTTINAAMSMHKAIRNAKALFEDAADRMFRTLLIGMRLDK
ncbi:MAG: glycerate kinase [Clostridia bacterium]